MQINSITIVQTRHHDEVYLDTDLEPTLWPFTESPSVHFMTIKDLGEAYCKKNFPNVPILNIVEDYDE